MGVRTRREYHWLDGRVIPIVQERPSGRGPWRGPRRHPSLVAAVEESRGGIVRIVKGGAYTDTRMSDAMARHFGIDDVQGVSDGRVAIPDSVIDKIARSVREAIIKVNGRFPKLADEDRTTGALFGNLESTIEEGGWRVRLTHQIFSAKTKEPRTGADGGVYRRYQRSRGPPCNEGQLDPGQEDRTNAK